MEQKKKKKQKEKSSAPLIINKCFIQGYRMHPRVRERTEEERFPLLKLFDTFFYYYDSESKYLRVAYEIVDTILEALDEAKKEGLLFRGKVYDKHLLLSRVFRLTDTGFCSVVKSVTFKGEILNRPYYILAALLMKADELDSVGDRVNF